MPLCTFWYQRIRNSTDDAQPPSVTARSDVDAGLNDSFLWPYSNGNLTGLQFNLTSLNQTKGAGDSEEGFDLNELQMIKAVVLIAVVSLLLLSTCRVVLKTFSRYSGKSYSREGPV